MVRFMIQLEHISYEGSDCNAPSENSQACQNLSKQPLFKTGLYKHKRQTADRLATEQRGRPRWRPLKYEPTQLQHNAQFNVGK